MTGHETGRVVTLGVSSLEETKRMNILSVMTGQGPLSMREVSRRVKRDVKSVHSDLHALLSAGVIDRTESGAVLFPYDQLHVDFYVTPENDPRVA